MSNDYVDPGPPRDNELANAIEKDDVDRLPELIISVALYDDDRELAEGYLKMLTQHEDEVVRGNAVLGLGHLSRRFRTIGDDVQDIVKKALVDPSEYVRGQAHAAADDLEHFLGISLTSSD